jgi:hypothetical protein
MQMTYQIEVSFNISKHTNITEMKNNVIDLGRYCHCEQYFEHDIEYHHSGQVNVIFSFLFTDICGFIQFIKGLKKITGTHIEIIYNEDLNNILYASKYYQTRKMEKFQQKLYLQQRKRSYSEDEMKILSVFKSFILI